MIELPEDRWLTPGDMLLIQEAIDKLEEFVHEKRQKIMEDKLNWMAAGGGMTTAMEAAYKEKQALEIQEMERVESRLKELVQMMQDTALVLGASLFERAKLIHQAMSEASKTDPSLLDAVREFDALYEQALREQQELNEDNNDKPENQ